MELTGGRRRNLRCFPLGRLQADLYLGSGRVDARSGQRIECEWSPAWVPARLAVTRCILRSSCCAAAVFAALLMAPASARAETMPDALVRTYQTNPQLNAERAKQRATDERVPQALSRLPAADHRQAQRRPEGGAQPAAGQHCSPPR